MATAESVEYNTLPNPYVKDAHEGAIVNAEVGSLLRVASILEPAANVQMAAVRAWVPLVTQGSREIQRAVIWEICNQVRQHASMGLVFPHWDMSDCQCGEDHTEAVNQYNAMLDSALAGDLQAVVDVFEHWMSAHIQEVLVQWLGVMSDHLADLRAS